MNSPQRLAADVARALRPAPPARPAVFEAFAVLGITNTALAEHLGVTDVAVSIWRNGRAPLPLHHLPALRGLLAEALRTAEKAAREFARRADLSPTEVTMLAMFRAKIRRARELQREVGRDAA